MLLFTVIHATCAHMHRHRTSQAKTASSAAPSPSPSPPSPILHARSFTLALSNSPQPTNRMPGEMTSDKKRRRNA